MSQPKKLKLLFFVLLFCCFVVVRSLSLGAGLPVSLCFDLDVCLFRAVAAEQRQRLPFWNRNPPTPKQGRKKKLLSKCAHRIADANQRIKGTLQADKEGSMPTSKPLKIITGDSPACQPGTSVEQNGAALHATTTWLHRLGSGTSSGVKMTKK